MATYTIVAGDTFSSIAAKLGMTVLAIEQANPGVNPNALQIGQVILLSLSASTYTIESGDTLSSIAAKFGVSIAALEETNPNVSPTALQVGAQISIPSSTVPSSAPAPSPSTPTYTIVTGDTLTSIATKLGTTVAALESANPGINPNDLQVGSQISTALATGSPAPQPTPTPAPTSTYVIRSGDTFTSIAAKLGTTVAALESANPSLTPTNLQVGASIVVPSGSVPTTVPATTPTPTTPAPVPGGTYTIAAGDTLTTIATKFSITLAALEAANPTVNPTTLQIGQVINLPSGAISSGAPTPISGQSTSIGGAFVNYSGPASAYPDPSLWAPYSSLWQQNSALMSYNDSERDCPHWVLHHHRIARIRDRCAGHPLSDHARIWWKRQGWKYKQWREQYRNHASIQRRVF